MIVMLNSGKQERALIEYAKRMIIKNPELQPPKVFISYTWNTPEHEAWVLEWAERLASDGVNTVLDKWDFKEGRDKSAFMQEMVADGSVSRVVIFSDRAYARKSDARVVGGGTETQIICKEVYETAKREKFISVVCEYEAGEPCLPAYLKSRKFLDFSTPEKANENYEKLVRMIFDKPLYKKPRVGKPPVYLFEEPRVVSSARLALADFKSALLNDRASYKGLAARFLQETSDKLEEFRITSVTERALDDLVLSGINELLPFRDDFVEFVALVCLMKDETELYEDIADFFERSLSLRFRPLGNTDPFYEDQFDNFKFLTYELFLYVIALLIKHKRFNRASIFLERLYFPPENSFQNEHTNFEVFCARCKSFALRNERLQLGKVSLEAELIKNRSSLKEISFEQLKQADGICLLKSLVHWPDFNPWFPHTFVYVSYQRPFELFLRGAAHKDFTKIATLLNVASKDDLVAKFKDGMEKHQVGQWQLFVHVAVNLYGLFNLDKLDTI